MRKVCCPKNWVECTSSSWVPELTVFNQQIPDGDIRSGNAISLAYCKSWTLMTSNFFKFKYKVIQIIVTSKLTAVVFYITRILWFLRKACFPHLRICWGSQRKHPFLFACMGAHWWFRGCMEHSSITNCSGNVRRFWHEPLKQAAVGCWEIFFSPSQAWEGHLTCTGLH